MSFRCGSYLFDFTSSGLFTLVDKQGEPLYEKAFPFFEKALSHLVWIFLWLTFILMSHYLLPRSWLCFTDRGLMSLIFLHLFFFGCRLTHLLIGGGLKPILFPPLWIRLTRKLQRDAGLEILKAHRLEHHPGLLVNLSLIHFTQGRSAEAEQTLRLALSHLPGHPHLIQLLHAISHSGKTD